MRRGDTVVTSGGLIGKVTKATEPTEIELEQLLEPVAVVGVPRPEGDDARVGRVVVHGVPARPHVGDQVVAQADAQFRSTPDDILRLQTRNADGQMVPFGAIMKVTETSGPDTAMRYNGFRTADLNGGPAPGYSSGQSQAAMTKILDETLPKGMTYEWTDLTYQQILSGNTALLVFPICVLLVFLVLAARYEILRRRWWPWLAPRCTTRVSPAPWVRASSAIPRLLASTRRAAPNPCATVA